MNSKRKPYKTYSREFKIEAVRLMEGDQWGQRGSMGSDSIDFHTCLKGDQWGQTRIFGVSVKTNLATHSFRLRAWLQWPHNGRKRLPEDQWGQGYQWGQTRLIFISA